MSDLAAVVYAVLAAVVVIFQVALALGAPWGEMSMGGRYPGTYPPAMRGVAVVSALIVAFMAVVVLSRAGLAFPGYAQIAEWAIWLVVAYSGVGLVMNLATPSKKERAIWAPIVAVMLVCSVVVALS